MFLALHVSCQIGIYQSVHFVILTTKMWYETLLHICNVSQFKYQQKSRILNDNVILTLDGRIEGILF